MLSSSDPEVVAATVAAIERRLERRDADGDASAESDRPGLRLVYQDKGRGGADG